MLGSRIIYALYACVWAIMFVAGPAACTYSLMKPPLPTARRRSVGVAILGLFLSAMIVLGLAVTTLIPLAAAILPAPLIFAVAAFFPSILTPKGPRIYLISCMVVGELFWIWAAWDQFVRVLP
jgi:hypothetical protein